MSAVPIRSPWLPIFRDFLEEAAEELILIAPYVGQWPLSLVGEALATKTQPLERVWLASDFNAQSLQSGSLDIAGVLAFAQAVPEVSITHIPRLHAKVYLSENAAITTSANLTTNGLLHNYEYGTQIKDAETVGRIKSDVLAYFQLGSTLGIEALQQIGNCVAELQQVVARVEESREGYTKLQKLIRQQQVAVAEQILKGRASGESIESLFKRTVLYILKLHGPLPTTAIHQLVQQLQPDVCDDTLDRVINGERFGKKWKHQVRSAQAALQRNGLIKRREDLWYLTD